MVCAGNGAFDTGVIPRIIRHFSTYQNIPYTRGGHVQIWLKIPSQICKFDNFPFFRQKKKLPLRITLRYISQPFSYKLHFDHLEHTFIFNSHIMSVHFTNCEATFPQPIPSGIGIHRTMNLNTRYTALYISVFLSLAGKYVDWRGEMEK